MRQATLGSLLSDLYDLDFTHRVRVETLETGDVNNPGWETALAAVDLQVQQISGQERVARAEDYSLRLTHIAFADATDEVVIGAQLVETYQLDEHGVWQAVAAADAETWIVLGKEKIRGLPEPWNQVQYDLNQMTPTQ